MSEGRCPGCGAAETNEGAPEEGALHPYMLGSAHCWRAFNAIMAREYETPELMPTHYLSVDAYAAQHPGDPQDRRSRQSVWIHLAGLNAVLRDGKPTAYRYDLLRRLAEGPRVFATVPEHVPFALVAADIAADLPVEEHRLIMRKWAEATLSAYEAATPDIASQLAQLG